MSNQEPSTFNNLEHGETVTKAQREKDIRAAIERVFEHGVVPSAVIVFADLGPGTGKVRVSAAGPTIELPPLAVAGCNQLADMLAKSFKQAITDNVEAPHDKSKLN